MEKTFWISELGRLFERSSEAISEDQSDAIEPLSEEFNETLAKLQDEFPDNELVQSTEPVEGRTEGYYGSSGSTMVMNPSRRRNEALHEIRSRCEKMANAIGYDLPELETGARSPNRMVMVSVETSQEATQQVRQNVTVESIQNMIQSLPRAPNEKEELQALLDEFEAEIEGEQDQSRLRQLLSKADEISTDVATQMAVFALTHGATAVLGI